MRHLKSGRKLSRRKDHRRAMLANLAASLVIKGKVKTTDAKAKAVRPFVERMVTFAKRGDLHARRIVLARLKDAMAVKKLFDEIGPQYVNRFGGYTRIVKLGFRHGDNAAVSLIEFVKDEDVKKVTSKRETTKTKAKTEISKAAEKVKEVDEAVEEQTVDSTEEISEETIEEMSQEAVVEKAEENVEEIEGKTEESAEKEPVEEAIDTAPAEKTDEPPQTEAKIESEEKGGTAEESTDEREDIAENDNRGKE